MEYIDAIAIPENIQKFLGSFVSVVEFSVNTTDVLNGYGMQITKACVVKMYTERCRKCGFDGIYNLEEKCKGNHAWDREYTTVFSCKFHNVEDIRFAFDLFLHQPAFIVNGSHISRSHSIAIERYSNL